MVFVQSSAALLFATVCGLPAAHAAAQTRTAALRITADVGAHARLHVSRTVLHLDEPRSAGVPLQAAIDFDARARTHNGGEVVLTVEWLDDAVDRAQAGTVSPALSVSASGDGAHAGQLTTGTRLVVARWAGSGRHTGAVCFSVLGELPEGGLTVPVRMSLTMP